VEKFGVDKSSSGCGQVADSCENSSECAGSVKGGELIE
jgi:hypothetical protein